VGVIDSRSDFPLDPQCRLPHVAALLVFRGPSVHLGHQSIVGQAEVSDLGDVSGTMLHNKPVRVIACHECPHTRVESNGTVFRGVWGLRGMGWLHCLWKAKEEAAQTILQDLGVTLKSAW